ncbi:MAG TPA: hypothetical protein VFE13_10420 [Caulobacteraceae bacterium]|nr:hypothetical protein [Caulobacteraceae bacterium]
MSRTAVDRLRKPARPRSNDRSVRSLVYLSANASTARTLNLISVWQRCEEEPDYRRLPFFESTVLNRSIIVKHRLRNHERDAFRDGRSLATKVILPIDPTDLGVGARSFFVGQKGYEVFLDEVSGGACGVGGRDDLLLGLLDTLPSLDPFLMRERLKKDGFYPARCYFDLTDADMERMFQFVRAEVAPLIGMSFGDLSAAFDSKTQKLASKILANASDAEFEPLRQGLDMTKQEFEEGMFCWKGFIYYKWTLGDLLPRVRPVASHIASMRPSGVMTDDEREYIIPAQARLAKSIARTCETVRLTLKVYEDAYADLTKHGQPRAFREFLLKAPTLFYELGERLGAVHHIVNFWNFRFPQGERERVSAEELFDLLADFEASLSSKPGPEAA